MGVKMFSRSVSKDVSCDFRIVQDVCLCLLNFVCLSYYVSMPNLGFLSNVSVYPSPIMLLCVAP